MNTFDTRTLQAQDAAHYLHPFTDFKALASVGARVMVRGDGIYIWDSEGKRLIDGMSGLWCVNVGYGRKELADAAYAQMRQMPFYNSFFQTTNVPAVQLATLLAEVSPAQFQRVFFANSGSEANDTIVRMVRRYWDLLGQPDRQVIISRQNAYHGSTMAGASLGGMDYMHAQGGLPIPGIVHIRQPYSFEHGTGLSKEEFGLLAAGWLEEKSSPSVRIKWRHLSVNRCRGAGGGYPTDQLLAGDPTHLRQVRNPLVTDEVICGFGRLGQWFGCEYFGIRPDLMTLPKASLPATSAWRGAGRRSVADVLIEGREFNHGYTYPDILSPAPCGGEYRHHSARKVGRKSARRQRSLFGATVWQVD
jgi:putrescine aminotransferase